jgi:outer membrane protein
MKKLITLLILLLIQINSLMSLKAQTDKGNYLFGGQYTLVFSNKNIDDGSFATKQSAFEISPQIGYFIFKNIPIGLAFRYSYFKEIYNQETNTTTSLSLIPFIRTYFGNAKLRPYLHLGFGVGNEDHESKDQQSLYNTYSKIFIYQLHTGLGIRLNKHILFDLGIGYDYETINHVSGKYKTYNKGINSTLGTLICF